MLGIRSLELSEDEKFRDEAGNVYDVEVRGDKTKHSIRFSWVDASRLFEMKTHLSQVLDETEYGCSPSERRWILF